MKIRLRVAVSKKAAIFCRDQESEKKKRSICLLVNTE